MSVANKVKAVLNLKNSSVSKYAVDTNQTQPNVSNKLIRNTWTVQDFLKLAKWGNMQLAFIDENGKPIITFDNNDIESK